MFSVYFNTFNSIYLLSSAFFSPVTKQKLQRLGGFGIGAMGSRSCTLDDLLKASQ